MKNHFEIAVVEDEPDAAQILAGCVERYAKETGIGVDVKTYGDGISFLEDYTGSADIVFLDIEMPGLNGMDTARKLRKSDGSVVLVFVTNMAQYAIRGYEVEASDFIVKPLVYKTFAVKLKKLFSKCGEKGARRIRLETREGQFILDADRILYAESDKHYVVFHTADQDLRARMSLPETEALLAGGPFARCGASFLVNLSRVTRVWRDTVYVGETALPMSRSRKKEFLDALTVFVAGR